MGKLSDIQSLINMRKRLLQGRQQQGEGWVVASAGSCIHENAVIFYLSPQSSFSLSFPIFLFHFSPFSLPSMPFVSFHTLPLYLFLFSGFLWQSEKDWGDPKTTNLTWRQTSEHLVWHSLENQHNLVCNNNNLTYKFSHPSSCSKMPSSKIHRCPSSLWHDTSRKILQILRFARGW